jgi:large subunit ribosomal protein L29
MAKSSKKDLKDLTSSELQKNIRELKHEALHLRLQKATGQLQNSARIRAVRRDVARAETALSSIKLA